MNSSQTWLATILGVLMVLAPSLPRPAVAQPIMMNLTIHIIGIGTPPITGAVSVQPTGQVCNNSSATLTCSYPVPKGTAVRLSANSPTPSTPGLFSSGTSDAMSCGTSTCTFVINNDSEVTATFDQATPIYTITVNLSGDAKGEVSTDNSQCQNLDSYPSHPLPAQASACQQSYARDSVVTLTARSTVASRFAGFSDGTATSADVCTVTGTPCSFVLNASSSVTATFRALTSIAVQPGNPRSINIGQALTFTATGTFSDLVTGPISHGFGLWTTRASMNHARFDLGAAVAGGLIYAIGGVSSGPIGNVEVFDPSANSNRGSWTDKTPMPTPREGLGVATIDDQFIYAVGGDKPGACPADTLERYDVLTNTWATRTPMPGGPRRFLGAAAVGRTLYAIGGEQSSICGVGTGTAVKAVEAYNPDTDTWATRQDMPTARKGFGIGVLGGKIFVVGGGDESGNLSTVEVYDPATNTWSTKTPLPSGRSLNAVGVIDDVLYSVGGNNNGYLSSVLAYDPVTDAWSNRASIPALQDIITPSSTVGTIGGQRAELAVAALVGRLYAFGGLTDPSGTFVPYVTAFVDDLIWSTSDSTIATISNQSDNHPGQARGQHTGTTTVTARTGPLTSPAVSLTVNPSRDDLVVDFGPAFGLWLRNGDTTGWTQLHTLSGKNIMTGDLDGNGIDEVIVDFGPQGIWIYYNRSNWVLLHVSTANRMAVGDLDGNGKAELLVDFQGFGIWVWANNTSWFQLHSSNSNHIATGDLDGNGKKEVIIDFLGFGIWVWQNNTSWFQLHPLNSRLTTVGDVDGNGKDDVIVDFMGYGMWRYANNTSWSQIHTLNASHLTAGDVDGSGQSDVIVDFGSQFGIWMHMNGTTWSQIHTLTSTNMLSTDLDSNGKADVIVNFGAAGLWEYANNTSWIRLHTVSPGVMAAGHINAP